MDGRLRARGEDEGMGGWEMGGEGGMTDRSMGIESWIEGQTGGKWMMGGEKERLKQGWIGGWKDEWMEGWVDGRIGSG